MMKTLKMKSIVLGLMAAFLLVITIQSCTQQDLPIPTEELNLETPALNFESTTSELTQDDPIIVTLKASEHIDLYNTEAGELLWDMATMITYDNEETLPLVIIPIDNGSENSMLSMFVAAYSESDNTFLTYINNLEMHQETDIELGYTGTVEYKTVENVPIIRTKYVNSKVEEYEELLTEAEAAARGIDRHCFVDCIGPFAAGNYIFGIAPACIATAKICFSFPSVVNPACYAFAGCLLYYGGSAAYCAYQCNE